MTSSSRQSKVAAIQMCSSHDVDENLVVAEKMIAQAASNQARMVVLPENFAIMAKNPIERLAVKESFGEGKIQNFLAKAARTHQVWIVGGTIPIATNDANKVKAACLVYDDQGHFAARYDKIHLFDAVISDTETHQESQMIDPGHDIVSVDTPVGKLGLAICFDVRFPHQFRSLAKRGVEIIALPSAFTVRTGQAHWELLTRCRAIDTFAYIIGAGQGGTHSTGRQTYGHSIIVDPWGQIVAEKGDSEPGIIYAEIDLEHLYNTRKAIPNALDRD
mgnify:CR=1 FL=1